MKKKHYLCTVQTKINRVADEETTACKGSFFYSLADIEGYCRIPCAFVVMAARPLDIGLNSR